MNYFWAETNLGVTALVSCPCQEYLGTFAGNVRRLCNGTFTEGAMWSPTIDDSACETKRSDISRRLCDLAEVTIVCSHSYFIHCTMLISFIRDFQTEQLKIQDLLQMLHHRQKT